MKNQNRSSGLLAFALVQGFLVLFLVSGLPCSVAGSDRQQPNVLLIMTDDQGWGDLSLHGNHNLKTPNMDRLAEEGTRFANFYLCPVCSPTRCEVLTGRYYQRCGVSGVSRGDERINLDEKTMAEVFHQAGYRTGLFGKWHNGTQHPYHPNSRGFVEFYGFTSGHWGHYFSPELDHNGKRVQGNGYLSDDFTDRAIEFAQQTSDKPFFVKLSFCSPHSPMQVPDLWWEKFHDHPVNLRGTDAERENLQHTRAALAMVTNLDWNIGRLMESLRQSNQLDNTIILFMSDNGPNGHRFNAGLLGIKGSVHEGGVRSPLFVRYPPLVPAGIEVQQLAGGLDLLPTLIDVCHLHESARIVGVNDEYHPLDGISLARHLATPDEPIIDRTLWSSWNGRHSLRNQTFRYSVDGRLHDIQSDRLQQVDCSKEFPEQVAELKKELEALIDQVQRKDSAGRPFTVGYAAQLSDTLPARDADLSGGVTHSSIHPNCSFVTNWTSIDQRIEWPIEVLHDGKYAFEIYYQCPEEMLGSKMLLLVHGEGISQELQFTWEAGFSSEPIGAEDDRVPRVESYWKTFRPQELGVMELKAGVQTLVLQAKAVPHATVGEVFRVVVTRLLPNEES